MMIGRHELTAMDRVRALAGLPVPEGTIDAMYANGVGGWIEDRRPQTYYLGPDSRVLSYASPGSHLDFAAARESQGSSVVTDSEQGRLYQAALEQAGLAAGNRRTRAALGVVGTEQAVVMSLGESGLSPETVPELVPAPAEVVYV